MEGSRKTPNARYTIPEDVLVAHLEGEAVILSVKTKRYYQLNETAAAIWKQLERGHDAEAIVGALIEEFDVDMSTARAEVEHMLVQLEDKALITS